MVSESPGHRQSSIIGLEAVGCVEVVNPLAHHNHLPCRELREPDEARASTEALAFEVSEGRATAAVCGDLLVVVTANADPECLGEKLVYREVDMEFISID